MDMSMDGDMTLASGMMRMYFHFTPGDLLWFQGWVPSSTGAMVGSCIGLFLLAIIDRWVAACRGCMEVFWARRAQIIQSNQLNRSKPKSSNGINPSEQSQPPTLRNVLLLRSPNNNRLAPPFIPSHDIVRGLFYIAQALLGYLFMLAVMTYQVGFLFAILAGLGVGEMMFGRYAKAGGAGHGVLH
ncbi:Ctr copper transporter [Dendrothele bispora CBS 962.96]|uniref:Copper transport protein n=1 Tax=Dendrothele bispora (strain CBS 962.96) TaxID=1314807 RepID=A0A4S8M0T1_DENBC|nr:Ctr copper transporter [Dendrothele bispora CBS 962.96]